MRAAHYYWCLLLVSASMTVASPLSGLNIDASRVTAIGFDDAADFAHQLHIAYSATITGSCLFAAQPFHCAASHFSQDSIEPWTPWTRVPNCDGCIKGTRMPFDHCKKSPHVVDVGSLVDYPRRNCGQNPISIQECFDAVENFKTARVFAFQGTHDQIYQPGTIENTVALLAQMITDPGESIKLVNNLPFPHVLPSNSTPHVGETTPAGYDGPGECLRHVYNTSGITAADVQNSSWSQYDQTESTERGVGFQDSGWLYVPHACRQGSERKCPLMVLPAQCNPASTAVSESVEQFARYAEGSGLVLLHPCVGGDVNQSKYRYPKDMN